MSSDAASALRGAAILLTGAGGFVGKNLAPQLLHLGAQLTCTYAPWEKPPPAAPRLRPVTVDLASLRDATALVEGHDFVIHLAARTDFDGATYGDYEHININATTALAGAALKAGVRRFLFTSSIAAVGLSYDTFFATEDVAPAPINLYGRSKLDAEHALVPLVARGLPLTVIRPTSVYGPSERSAFLEITRVIARRRYFQIGDGENLVSYVYVDNLIQAFLLALQRPEAAGQTFTITDLYPYTMNRIIRNIALNLGLDGRFLHVPKTAGYALGLGCELAAALLRRKPILFRSRVRNLCSNYTYSVAKAVALLGFAPRVTLEDGIARTIRSFKDDGVL